MQVFGTEYAWFLLAASIVLAVWGFIIGEKYNNKGLAAATCITFAIIPAVLSGAIILLGKIDSGSQDAIGIGYWLWRISLLLSLFFIIPATITSRAKAHA